MTHGINYEMMGCALIDDFDPQPIGIKNDQGKPRFDLIPPRAENLLAQVLEFGSRKYAPNNWKLVENPRERYMAAALRHINAHRAGEVLDSESGLPHLAHALTCLTFLLELSE